MFDTQSEEFITLYILFMYVSNQEDWDGQGM